LKTAPWRTHGPIGLDFSGRRLCAVQLSSRMGAPPRVEAAATATRPGADQPGFSPTALGAEEGAFIAAWLRSRGFMGRQVVVGVPREHVMNAVLELPPRASGAPLAQIARLELARANRCDPAAFEFAMWDIPAPVRGGDSTHVMAAGVLTPTAHAIADTLELAGLDVVALDMRSLALARAAATQTATGMSAVIDVGWGGALLLLALEGVTLYTRHVDTASIQKLYHVLEDRLGVTTPVIDAVFAAPDSPDARGVLHAARATLTEYLDALVPEIARSVSYATHRYPTAPVTGVFITGEGARVPGLAERVGAELGAAARVLTLAALSPFAPDLRTSDDPGLIAALGLATGRAVLRKAAA